MRQLPESLPYRHVDVFSREPFSGNGLTVFPECAGLSAEHMQRITQEMRQFESIFLVAETEDTHTVTARIFTMEEELAFAGHPVLGAACVLHERLPGAAQREQWTLRLPAGPVQVSTRRHPGYYAATMDQGAPVFGDVAALEYRRRVLDALSLAPDDLAEGLPLQMVTTGLPYLLVPLRSGIERARIRVGGFEALLAEIGAKFVYVFDVAAREGRTWDNDGRVEDVATGSAAGPTGAYLVRYGLAEPNTDIALAQGRFLGRPSAISVRAVGTPAALSSVLVSGDVRMVASGVLDGAAG